MYENEGQSGREVPRAIERRPKPKKIFPPLYLSLSLSFSLSGSGEHSFAGPTKSRAARACVIGANNSRLILLP